MKKLLKLFIICLVVVFASSSLYVQEGLATSQSDFNRRAVDFKVINGRSFISTDEIYEFGVSVKNEYSSTIVSNEDVTMTFYLDSNKVKVNNIDLTVDCKTFKEDNKIYLPYRFLLETLNYSIIWDSGAGIVKYEKISDDTYKYPITIKNGDNEMVIEKEPSKIISLAPGVTEKLFEIGAGDKVVGRTQYCDYPKEVENIKNVGTLYEPNIEVIVDIQPEIAIAETHFKQEILDKLNEAGIISISSATPNKVEGIYAQIIQLGKIVNRNYEARALVSSMKSKVQKVKYVLNNQSNLNKPSIYYVVGTGQYGEYTAGSDTFIADIIRTVGATNIAADVTGWKYSVEKVIDKDPDIIVGNETNVDAMINNNNYSILTAVNQKSYYKVDNNIFDRSSPRSINEGLKILFNIVHSDLTKKLGF
ncbi:helical backbone metal receptor [Abyssisolibacter fermentans]|uniref:helical backbone metal receptor n=1 Tax=Abyssisolibacter fermentans TaxID=1766203 RepID=UPI00138ED0AC|nr:helical backbone metal receptor [Abyssisolibacter fermentans]